MFCLTPAFFFRTCLKSIPSMQGCRKMRGFSPPVFGQTVNPISTRGADYAHQSYEPPPLPDFQTLRRHMGGVKTSNKYTTQEGAQHCRKPLGRRSVTKGLISSEKYWHYFHCPKYELSSILSYSRN